MNNEKMLFEHPVDLITTTIANSSLICPIEFRNILLKLKVADKKKILSLYNLNHSYIVLKSETTLLDTDLDGLMIHLKRLLKLELIINNKLNLINKDTLFTYCHIKNTNWILFRFYSPEILYIMFSSASIFNVDNGEISLVCNSKTYIIKFLNASVTNSLLVQLFFNEQKRANIICASFDNKILKKTEFMRLFSTISELVWFQTLKTNGNYMIFLLYNNNKEDIELILNYINKLSFLNTPFKALTLTDSILTKMLTPHFVCEYPEYLKYLKAEDHSKVFQSLPSKYIAVYFIEEFVSVFSLEEYITKDAEVRFKAIKELKTKTVHSKCYLKDYLIFEFENVTDSESFHNRFYGRIYCASPIVLYYINEDVIR